MKLAVLIMTVVMFCACAGHRKDPLLMEENRRAALEMQSLQDLVTSRDIPPAEFKLGSDVLLPSSFDMLDRVAAILLRYPHLKLIVEGHTCDIGSDERNEQLSLQRAGSVKMYLVKKGIYPESIK
ncbi:MAG: OmpA family protein, partial [Elusimicrobiales bacterium]